jgi:hypothetical protein
MGKTAQWYRHLKALQLGHYDFIDVHRTLSPTGEHDESPGSCDKYKNQGVMIMTRKDDIPLDEQE